MSTRPKLTVNLPSMSLFTTCEAKGLCDGLTLADLVEGIRSGRWKADVELYLLFVQDFVMAVLDSISTESLGDKL